MTGSIRYEYEFVQKDELDAYGADGWRLVPVDPFVEVTKTLGQVTGQILRFVMERAIVTSGGNPCGCTKNPDHDEWGNPLTTVRMPPQLPPTSSSATCWICSRILPSQARPPGRPFHVKPPRRCAAAAA